VIRDFSLLHNIQNSSGSTPIQQVPGIFLPKVKQLKCQKNHSRPYNAEVRNKASHLSGPPTCLHSTNRNGFTSYCYMYRNTNLETAHFCSSAAQVSSLLVCNAILLVTRFLMSQRTAVPSYSDSCSVNTVNILPGLLDSAHQSTVIMPNIRNTTTTKLWLLTF
jgi:hypothetical protein